MAHPWHKLLVVDVEQTCWESGPPEGEVPDIIQVGFSIWDSVADVIQPPIVYHCRPERSSVSAYCTALTGITVGRAGRAEPFGNVCERMASKWGARGKAWAAFGDDASVFRAQCQAQGIPYPFGESYFNIAALYGFSRGERTGLAGALTALGLEFEGTPHRAGDDAFNAARVVRALIKGPERKTD